jgi:hypothetical protein
MVVRNANDPDGPNVQVGEDYAFCMRARAVGAQLVCDTRVRVWHHGDYAYGWEDADEVLERFDSMQVTRRDGLKGPNQSPEVKGIRISEVEDGFGSGPSPITRAVLGIQQRPEDADTEEGREADRLLRMMKEGEVTR